MLDFPALEGLGRQPAVPARHRLRDPELLSGVAGRALAGLPAKRRGSISASISPAAATCCWRRHQRRRQAAARADGRDDPHRAAPRFAADRDRRDLDRGGRLSFMVRNPAQVDAAVEIARNQTQPVGLGGQRDWNVT
jgi:hypothetical protein